MVAPPGTLDEQLGFWAMSCVADNPTPHYWYLSDARQFIAPYTYGAVFLFTSPPQKATLDYASPIGVPQPSLITDVTPLTITFHDSIIGAASGGVNIPVAQGLAPNVFTFSTSGDVATFKTSYPITNGFTVFIEPSNGTTNAATLIIQYTLPNGLPQTFRNYSTLRGVNPIRYPVVGSFPAGTTFTLALTYIVAQTIRVWIL